MVPSGVTSPSRRDQRDVVAEHEAEVVGQARADRDALAVVEAVERALPDVVGDDRELAEVLAADAAHQRAGAGADGAATPAPGPRSAASRS